MVAYDLRNLHIIDKVKANLTSYVSPAFAHNIVRGVREELDQNVFMYLDDLEAVLLTYQNVKVVCHQALLTPWIPYLTIKATADLFLFRPNPGEILVGRVHKMTPGMIGILVLGGVHAFVSDGQMPDGFKYDHENTCWVPSDNYNDAISIGDVVACRALTAPVLDPEGEELVYNLNATLLDEHAGRSKQQPLEQQQQRKQLVRAARKAERHLTEQQHEQQPQVWHQQDQQQLQQHQNQIEQQPVANGLSIANKKRLKEEKPRAKEQDRAAKKAKRKKPTTDGSLAEQPAKA